MEFEKNTDDTSPEVSDAVRLSAAAKHISLTPIHADLVPEERPVSEDDGNLRAGGTAFATIDTETEDTGSYQNKATATSQPLAAKSPATKIIVLVVVIAAVVAAGAYAYLQLQ